MKKRVFGILIAVLALSMIFTMTGCSTDDPPGDEYTVSFDVDGGDGVADAIVVAKGSAVGDLPTAGKKAGVLFDGWKVGNLEIDATYKPDGDVTAVAQWLATSANKVSIKYGNGETPVVLTIELNTDTWSDVLGEAVLKRPQWIDTSKEFAGWYDSDDKRVDTKSADEQKVEVSSALVLTAKWASTALDTSGAVLKMALENSSFAIFKFELPEGKKLSDYTGFSADYKVPESSLYKQIRAVRLMGPYSETTYYGSGDQGDWEWEGDFVTNELNGVMTAKFDQENASAILYNGVGWSYNWASVQGKTGDDPAVANEWFTITYPINGEGAHGSYNHERLTIEESTLYFGVGIPANTIEFVGAGENKIVSDYYGAMVQAVKDVKLTSASGDVVGVPAVTAEGKPYIASQLDPIVFSWVGAPDAAIVPPAQEGAVPPVVVPPATPATEELSVDLTGLTVKNATAWTEAYQTLGPYEIEFPEGLDARSYSKYTVKAKAYAEDGTDITEEDVTPDREDLGPGWSIGQVVFLTGSGWTALATQYNINKQTENAAFPDGVKNMDPSVGFRVAIQNSQAAVAFLEVTEITFIP